MNVSMLTKLKWKLQRTMTESFLKEGTLQMLAINSGTSSGVRKHRFVTNGKWISYARFKKGLYGYVVGVASINFHILGETIKESVLDVLQVLKVLNKYTAGQ